MQIRRVHLRTHHGYAFNVQLYNAVTYSHFGYSNWAALCKACGFQEGTYVTFDLGDDPEDDMDEDNVHEANIDIWVDVQTLPLLPLCEFLKHIE